MTEEVKVPAVPNVHLVVTTPPTEVIESVEVAAFGLVAFLQAAQERISEGFSFDFTKNEGCPSSYTGLYSCLMYKLPVKKAEVKTRKAKA